MLLFRRYFSLEFLLVLVCCFAVSMSSTEGLMLGTGQEKCASNFKVLLRSVNCQ